MMNPLEVLPIIEAGLDCSPEFSARLMSIMARRGLYSPPRASLIRYRAKVACKLLSDGMARPLVRDALQARLGVSRRSAYRLIQMALDERMQARKTGLIK